MTDPRPEPLPPEVDANWVEQVSDLIEAGGHDEAVELVANLHAADLADIVHHLSVEEARSLFRLLPEEQAADLLPELEDHYRGTLLGDERPVRVSTLLDALDTDDAADVLADLPEALVRDVLPRLEDRRELRELLEYHEETAGGLMEAEYVAVRPDMTVARATEEVRRLAEEVDPVYAVYVVDEDHRLLGVVGLKRLLVSRERSLVADIMDGDYVSVSPTTDQEEVARLMERRDLAVLPVVDDDGRLLGRITIDDVVDVIREEAEEDLHLMGGIAGDEELTASVFKISRGRLVWLAIGLIGASFSALVINQFEHVLEQAVVLAVFIPVVMAMGGNAGMQSSAIAVQGLASGEIWSSDVGKRLGKELAVAVVNGVPLAAAFGATVVLLQVAGVLSASIHAIQLATTVGLSLLTVIVLAAAIGATVPLVLDHFGIDPALATGPFVTTSNDILGLLVYFLIATTLYLG